MQGQPNWKKKTPMRRTAVREAGVSRQNGAQLRPPLKPLGTLQLYRIEGHKECPQFGYHYFERVFLFLRFGQYRNGGFYCEQFSCLLWNCPGGKYHVHNNRATDWETIPPAVYESLLFLRQFRQVNLL